MAERMRPDFAQGFRLSSSWLAWVGVFVVAASTLACLVLTFRVRHDGVALAGAVRLSTSVIWWGSLVLIAFALSTRVLHRLRDGGLATLVHLRTGRNTAWQAYLVGMCARLCAVALPPLLLVGLAALALAPSDRGLISSMLVACLVATVAFAATLGSVAMAALGGRSRAGGYLRLFAILTIPELASSSLSLSKEMRGMTSIPALLSTLVDSLSRGNLSQLIIVMFVLASVVTFAVGVTRFEWARVLHEPDQ
jgi:hypothetical protein